MKNSKDLKEEIEKIMKELEALDCCSRGCEHANTMGEMVAPKAQRLIELTAASLNQEWRERIEKVTERKLREPILKEEDLVRRARIRLKSWNKAMAHVRKSLLNPEA